MTLRALGAARPVRVVADPHGAPRTVRLDDGRVRVVASIRDDWRVQDLWWTERPIDRHYFEVVLDPGRLIVLYRDLADDTWHAHP